MSFPTNLTAQTYSPSELSQLPPPNKYLFAHPTPQLTPPPPTLTTSRSFTSFNIYPTTQTSLTINQFLHQCVHNSHLPTPPTSAPILGAPTFILGLNPDLYHFLHSITLPQLDQSITDFLVLLHHKFRADSDFDAISAMSHDLHPSIWSQVQRNLPLFPNGHPPAGPRAAILEHLVHISFLTPWRVDVFGAYHTTESSPSPSPSPIPGRLMAKMYQDWLLFRSLFCARAFMVPYSHAAEAVERMTRTGKAVVILQRVKQVLRECQNKRSWLSAIPPELVEERLVPWILKRSCEMIAPARRRVPNLKTLLDMSARVLDELREEGLPVELEEETGDMVAALVGDGVGGEVTLGERVGVGVLTRRVLEDGLEGGEGMLTWAEEEEEDDESDAGWYAGWCDMEQEEGDVYPLDEGVPI